MDYYFYLFFAEDHPELSVDERSIFSIKLIMLIENIVLSKDESYINQ